MSVYRILTAAIAASIGVCVAVPVSHAQKPPRARLAVSQPGTRNMQTRAFDTTDEKKTLRAVIATLQDLDFVVTKADEVLGTITAMRIDRYPLKTTITVRPRGETQVEVRLNMYYHRSPVRKRLVYLDFFTSLANTISLTAHPVE